MRNLAPCIWWLVVAAAALSSMGVLNGQRFSVHVDVVRVDALVTDDGRPVTGLTPEDFELRDNGVRQRIDMLEMEALPARIVLALDTSGSVEGPRLAALTNAAQAVLGMVRASDDVVVLGFSNAIRILARQRGPSDSPSVLRNLTAGGTTSLFDAAHAALLLARSENARPLALVFSDGRDNSSWLSEKDLLTTARRAGVVAYTVGLQAMSGGGRISNDALERLAEATGGRFVLVQSDRDLRATFVRVLDEFRQRYVIAYTPTGVARAGWHQIQVTVKRRGATVKARAGYAADRP